MVQRTFELKMAQTKARDWPLLAYVFHIRSTSGGFRVQGSEISIQGQGSRVQNSGFRVQGSGFRGDHLGHLDERAVVDLVQGLRFRVKG